MWLILYLLALAALALRAPDVLWQPGAREFVVILGLVGAWRYSWGAVHLGRALYYRGVVFPRWRRAADHLGEAGAASHVYILIATYRIRAEATARVYQAAIAEAIRYGRPATIVAGIVETGDQRLIKRIFEQMSPPAEVRLAFVRRPGIGKRHQMACSLRAISRLRPPRDAAVVFMDGDTLLTPGCLAKSLPFLKLMPDVDAITTDEECIVANGPRHAGLAQPAVRPAPPDDVVDGPVPPPAGDHRADVDLPGRGRDQPRLHRDARERPSRPLAPRATPLLTGEDKSTWYWLLQAGRRMLYLPDVSVVTLEYPLAKGLLPATTKLMLRWFGNMLRGSSRAIALGPRRIGLFVWWCLIDQRLSMWTPLLGPVVAVLFALSKSALFLYAYLLWVAMTRLVQALLLLTARPTISGLYPPLIYFGQVYGALVKTYILFRLDRQRWTRQNIALEVELSPWQARLRNLGSAYLHILAIGTLIAAVALSARLLSLPPLL